jgi:hypothetical protein
VADRVQQVRLAEARRAVEEERVVRLAGQLGDGERRRVGKAVGVADDELVERELRVQLLRLVLCRARLGRRARAFVDRCVGRDDVDGRLRSEDRGGAGLQDAGVAIGDPAADLVGRRDDELVADERPRPQRGEPDLERGVGDLLAQLRADQRPVAGELRGDGRRVRLLRGGGAARRQRALRPAWAAANIPTRR